MNISKELIGKRIKLKKTEADFELAKTMYAVIDKNRDVFAPWLGWAKTTLKPEDTFDFLHLCSKSWEEEKSFGYAIFHSETFIGFISVLNVAISHKRAEIGYWLDTKHTGNGYIQEAVGLIEKELFDNDFNKLIIHTDVNNIKSANVAKKLGYVHEGVLRQQIYSPSIDRYRDQNVFSKLKNEYNIKE